MIEKGRISVVIPSRNEKFLVPTVNDILTKAAGDVEVIVALDGYWPDPPLPDDKRIIQFHRGGHLGMRPGINQGLACSRGEFVMKLDGHCMLDEGWDEKLKANCADNWLVVPRRYRLDPETWSLRDVGKPPVDAHYLSFPYERPGDRTCGLHGTIWPERARERKEILIDDEMSSQGSCWFTTRKWWERRLCPMEVPKYGTFAQEFQELGLKTWLGGGEVKVNKTTWYAHLHKGSKYGTGYGFSNKQWDAWKEEKEKARLFTINHWMHDRWSERTHDIEWLIEKFWPVPGWPDDWQSRRDG